MQREWKPMLIQLCSCFPLFVLVFLTFVLVFTKKHIQIPISLTLTASSFFACACMCRCQVGANSLTFPPSNLSCCLHFHDLPLVFAEFCGHRTEDEEEDDLPLPVVQGALLSIALEFHSPSLHLCRHKPVLRLSHHSNHSRQLRLSNAKRGRAWVVDASRVSEHLLVTSFR